MKFEYDKEEDRGEVVAFIDKDGDLWLRKGDDDGTILGADGTITPHYGESLESGMAYSGVIKKFYRGDKITITF